MSLGHSNTSGYTQKVQASAAQAHRAPAGLNRHQNDDFSASACTAHLLQQRLARAGVEAQRCIVLCKQRPHGAAAACCSRRLLQHVPHCLLQLLPRVPACACLKHEAAHYASCTAESSSKSWYNGIACMPKTYRFYILSAHNGHCKR